jgi:hypothetical protein
MVYGSIEGEASALEAGTRDTRNNDGASNLRRSVILIGAIAVSCIALCVALVSYAGVGREAVVLAVSCLTMVC